MCSCQFGTRSCQFGILSRHQFFQFHESENVPAFFFLDGGNRRWVDVGMAGQALSRCGRRWVDVGVAGQALSRCRYGSNDRWVDVGRAATVFLIQNEVHWVPTLFFLGIPNFGIGIPICRFFNRGIQKIKSDGNLWNQKRNRNSASNGGPRNWNQKLEFPTKVWLVCWQQ